MAARRPGRYVALLAAVAAGAAACGSSTSTSVDSVRLGDRIATGLASQYAVAKPSVTCPSGEANVAGTVFACHTTLAGQALAVNAEVHKPDQVNWQPAEAVISVAKTEQTISEQFAPRLGTDRLTVSCGAGTIKVVAVGTTFTCTAPVDGSVRSFGVTASDINGTVGLSLLPPASGSGSTTPPVTAAPTPGSVPSGTLPGD